MNDDWPLLTADPGYDADVLKDWLRQRLGEPAGPQGANGRWRMAEGGELMLLRMGRPPFGVAVRIADMAVAAAFKLSFENPPPGSPDPCDVR